MTIRSRVRTRLERFEPMYVGALGLLALPSYIFESLEFLFVFHLFFLFFLWPFVAPMVDFALRWGDDTATDAEDAADDSEPTDWIHMGDWREYAVAYAMIPLIVLNPVVLTQDMMQLFGSVVALVRHRGSVPGAETYEQRTSYRLPFDGSWTVVNGSLDREYSHSWFPVNQRYAYDFVITDEDGRSRPAGSKPAVENYYCYDEPMLAPAGGVVVDVSDGDVESSRGGGFSHPLKRTIAGNAVVIQHAEREYSTLAHLKPGSVTVSPGDHVVRGEEVGRCGHTGNSSEPHLHFQVQDHPDFSVAASLPIEFDDVDVVWPGGAPTDVDDEDADSSAIKHEIESVDDGDVDGHGNDGTNSVERARSPITAGQRVTHAPSRTQSEAEPVRDRTRTQDSHARTVDSAEDVRSPPPAGRSRSLAILQRLCFGVCLGGVLAFFAQIVASWTTVALLLGSAAVIGAGFWAGDVLGRREGDAGRSGAGGAVVGLCLAALAVAGYGTGAFASPVGPVGLGVSLFLGGFVGHVALVEYDRRTLRAAFVDEAAGSVH